MHKLVNGNGTGLCVRAFLQDAVSCEVVDPSDPEGQRYPLERLTEDGFFEGLIPDRKESFLYRLRLEQSNGEIRQFYDPYRFPPSLSEDTVALLHQGSDCKSYEKFGAHFREIDGIQGVAFLVWAPRARHVCVAGDFNHWEARFHPMRNLGNSGIWELFIPGLAAGVKYKYAIGTSESSSQLKTDPYGTQFEAPPYNASIICDVKKYQWNDTQWIEARRQIDWQQQAIAIYEVHLGSWKRVPEDGHRPLNYRECAHELVAYLTYMHYTHVEFLPMAEHPFNGSWGYQVTGFFAPTHRYGNPQDFMYLVDTLHQNGFGVILDWVPAHFPADSFALANFDGAALYEYGDPRQGLHRDWGTLIFDYANHQVRAFLIASALSWLDSYHIDGLRVDAVASMLYLDYSREEGEWIPNKYGGRENLEAIEFLRETNDLVHRYYPGTLMIAEESTTFPNVTKPSSEDGLGFDLKWNMGWMHDTLKYFQTNPSDRESRHDHLTFGMLYQHSEKFTQVFSHDEVVHCKASMLYKMPGNSISEKARHLRLLYGLMWLWPGKKTLFMGSDFGQSAEWNYDVSLDWHLLQYMDHKGIQRLVRDLNKLYQEVRWLATGDGRPEGFQWVNCTDRKSSTLSFLRKGFDTDQLLLAVGNFGLNSHDNFRVGVPSAGVWNKLMNTDAKIYGGLSSGKDRVIEAEAIPHDKQPFSLVIELPPLSMHAFKLENCVR